MEFHCWNSSSGEAPAPSGPARRISQTLLILRQENKPQMIQNSLPFSELTCRGWSGATAALIYQFSGQFSPGLLSQAWPKTQNQNETLKKPSALVQTDLLPPNFGGFFPHKWTHQENAVPSFSQTMPSGNWFYRGLDLAGNLCLWANSPPSSWCNCLLSAFLITEYSSVTQASMQSFFLLYAAYGYVYQSRNNWRIDILFILFSNAVGSIFVRGKYTLFFITCQTQQSE